MAGTSGVIDGLVLPCAAVLFAGDPALAASRALIWAKTSAACAFFSSTVLLSSCACARAGIFPASWMKAGLANSRLSDSGGGGGGGGGGE